MLLQRRLTIFFILIVILPLTVAGFVVHRAVLSEVTRRAALSLQPALSSGLVRYNDRMRLIDELVPFSVEQSPRFGTLLSRSDGDEIREVLRERVKRVQGLDFLIALDENKDPVASAAERADFAPGFTRPTLGVIAAGEPGGGPGYSRSGSFPVRVAGTGRVGFVFGGFWLDDSFLSGSSHGAVDTFVVSDGKVIASTRTLEGPVGVDVPESDGSTIGLEIDGPGQAVIQKVQDSTAMLAWTPTAPIEALSARVVRSLLALLAVSLIAITLLAHFLARLITRPLEEVSQGAMAIAEGRFDHRIPVRSKDEVGRLAAVFNDMSDRLKATVTALASSRDSLQRAVERVGETLRSTHDMDQLLGSILNTAADAVGAEGAELWLLTAGRGQLYPSITRGPRDDRVAVTDVGEGIVGLVAERGVTVSVPASDGGPRAALSERACPVTIATPVFNGNRIIGVLALHRPDENMPFTREDVETAVFLAEQGGVAIENVLLHQEAQKLSLTDGLTTIWNRRYLQMQFRQVLATSSRFRRPFCLLMLDLDDFKEINDRYGHQRGDAVLVEFTRRVSTILREVDTFARYGGEEFVCLLPETDVKGALTTAEKIREAIRAQPFFALGDEAVPMTVSIGIATYPEHGNLYTRLIEAADQALYRAKDEGKDRTRTAGSATPGLQIAT
jgi:diguanylate cyclase (GGDEF)-like protein